MIAKQIKGKSFRGVLNYLAQKQGSKLIHKNMGGNTPATLAKEFAVSCRLNPRLKKVVYHASLSLPKTEKLNNHIWSAIANKYLEEMGFSDSQYAVYRHSDRNHDHIHIVASRVRITNGTTVNDSWDYLRSEKLIRKLEKKYELSPTISFNQKLQRGQTTGEMRLIERTGEDNIRTKLQQTIDEETKWSIAMPELVARLKKRGINSKITLTREGKVKGISYQLEGIAVSGTHLGRAYTFLGLQKHKNVSYKHHSHYQKLEKLVEMGAGASIVKEAKKEEQKKSEVKLSQIQQKERSLIIAPILRDCINQVKKAEIKIGEYHISWQKEKETLYLYFKSEVKPRLKIKYQNREFKPIEPAIKENRPILTDSDVNYWQKLAIRLNQVKLRNEKRKKQRQQKTQIETIRLTL